MTTFDNSIDYSELIKRQISKLNDMRSGRETALCIGTTRKVGDWDFYFTPLRESNELISASVVVGSVESATRFASAVDGLVDYVIVDVENKISDGAGAGVSIEGPVRGKLLKSVFLPFKSNDLTVDAIEKMITAWFLSHNRTISGATIAIIGSGNIGSKLALRMAEMGLRAQMYRRSKTELEKTVSGINAIISAETTGVAEAFFEPLPAAQGADIIIGLAPGSPVVTEDMIKVMNPAGLLIDGGKGCVDSAAIILARTIGIATMRADIRSAFSGLLTSLLGAQRIAAAGAGSQIFHGQTLVPAGFLALKDEIIVDSTPSPKRIIGIADGFGELYRSVTAEQLASLTDISISLGCELPISEGPADRV